MARWIDRNICIVISYYNGRPDNHLHQLLAHLREFPAGAPFQIRIVVNQEIPVPLDLPSHLENINVYYRENTGYNIGAWDHGWRVGPPCESYVFLQDECIILKPYWLRRYLTRLGRESCGLVGESVTMDMPWLDYGAYLKSLTKVYGTDQEWLDVSKLLAFLERHDVPPGRSARHLQALILAARRDVLEAAGGFLIGKNKTEAIAAELAVSRKVAALGYRVEQASFLPFTSIIHPQWAAKRAASRSLRTVLRLTLERVMPPSLYYLIRRKLKRY